MSEQGPGECRQIFARLSEYLDGELDPEICTQIDDHMDGCAPCQAFVESLRRTIDWTRQLPDRPLPADLRREVIEAHRYLKRRFR